MWSLGALTATLLTGSPILTGFTTLLFPTPTTSTENYKTHPNQNLLALAVRQSFAHMTAAPEWTPVGPHPKDFVRRLLDPDETTRMDVRRALRHRWFACDEFEAVYWRAVRGWKPRIGAGEGGVIEELDVGKRGPEGDGDAGDTGVRKKRRRVASEGTEGLLMASPVERSGFF